MPERDDWTTPHRPVRGARMVGSVPSSRLRRVDIGWHPDLGCPMISRRPDAQAKRAKLLEAGEAVLLEFGVAAPLDLIAERAGVGRATLFRHFSDRNALLLALLDQSVTELEMEADRCADAPDGLRRLLAFVAGSVLDRALLVDYWQSLSRNTAEVWTTIDRVMAAFERPVLAAHRAGTCRSDFTTADILIFTSMLGAVRLARSPGDAAKLVHRALDIMTEAAFGPSPEDAS